MMMLPRSLKSASLLAAGLLSSSYALAEPVGARDVICPTPGMPLAPGMTSPVMPQTTEPTVPDNTDSSGLSPFQKLVASKSSTGAYSANITPPGATLSTTTTASTAMNDSNPGDRGFSQGTFESTVRPLILPGLFTALTTQSAWPVNRLTVDYGYFDGIEVNAGGIRSGFDLHSFGISGEYALFPNTLSLYFRAPFLNATGNTTGQELNGIGDVSLGLKYAIYADQETGTAFSAGLTVALPTAPDLNVVTNRYKYDRNFDTPTLRGETQLAPTQTETINPTFWQPYLAGVLGFDQISFQGYAGVLIPDDSRVAVLGNFSVGLNYALYQQQGDWLSSVTPTFGIQGLTPFTHRGNGAVVNSNPPIRDYAGTPLRQPANPSNVTVNAIDQLFLLPGCQFGIGRASLFSVTAVVPVSGPKAYSTGFTCSLSWLF